MTLCDTSIVRVLEVATLNVSFIVSVVVMVTKVDTVAATLSVTLTVVLTVNDFNVVIVNDDVATVVREIV